MSHSLRTLSISSYTFPSLVKSLKVLIKGIKKDAVDDIGLTLIMILYAIVQGYMSQLFIEHLKKSDDYKTSLNNSHLISFRLMSDLILNPDYSLEKIQKNYKLIDVDLAKVDEKGWAALMHLKNIRNIVAHGSTISFNMTRQFTSDTDEIERVINSKYSIESTFSYLLNEELIDFDVKGQFKMNQMKDRFDLFHYEVIKHFIIRSQFFIRSVSSLDHFNDVTTPKNYIEDFLSIELD